MATAPPSAAQEWRAHGMIAFSAMLGYSFVTIPSTSLGLFMEPLEQAFGWGRAEVTSGLAIMAIITTPLAPIAGWLADRLGCRTVVIPGLALNALVFAAMGLITGPQWQWILLWVAYSLTQLPIRSMVWTSAVSAAFSVSRGLALAVVMSGIAIASTLVPPLTRWLIDSFGWQGAFAGLGFGWGGMGLVMVVLFFRDLRKEPVARTADTQESPAAKAAPGGLTLGQAVRDHRILRIGFAMFLQSSMAAAFIVHLVPMLSGSGLTRATAAGLAAMLGLAGLTGQLVTGWLADRTRGSLLPMTIFILPALGYAAILQGAGSLPILALGVLLGGVASSATINMATYLTSRYAGVRSFGAIFGAISSLMGLGGGCGPLIAGMIYDATHSYAIMLTAGIVAAVLAGAALFGLGPYPNYETSKEA